MLFCIDSNVAPTLALARTNISRKHIRKPKPQAYSPSGFDNFFIQSFTVAGDCFEP